MKELLKFINDYKKINGFDPAIDLVKLKINEFLKEENSKVKQKSKLIYFRESQWSDYLTLRNDLCKDSKFVKEYAGVDLKIYIEDAIAWSEKGHKSTNLGWKLTLKNWIRKAKNEGKLIMKPKQNIKDVFNNQ